MTVTPERSLEAATRWPTRSAARRLGIAGLAGVGVSFGFARYGYGLFLPDIRAEFGLTVSAVGLIGSVTYVGYMTALVLVGISATRLGPRVLVAAGGASAALGTAMVGLAPGVGVLCAGLIVAGTSPGWIWAPYSDAVDRLVPEEGRQRVLALIPSGTAFGMAVAGPLALVAHGTAWRWAWLVFAAGAVAATVYNLRVLPRGGSCWASASASVAVPRRPVVGLRWFARRSAALLYLTAMSYGLVGSVYWLLAVEAVATAEGGGDRTAALFWTLMGVAGTAAVWTGVVFTRLGLRRSHVVVFAALAVAVVLLAVAPGSGVAVAVSAVAYGPAFMAGSALLAVWSYGVFPERPTTGFSATVFFLGIGTVAGPATVGAIADQYGLRTAFLLTAAVAGLTILARPGISRRGASSPS